MTENRVDVETAKNKSEHQSGSPKPMATTRVLYNASPLTLMTDMLRKCARPTKKCQIDRVSIESSTLNVMKLKIGSGLLELHAEDLPKRYADFRLAPVTV